MTYIYNKAKEGFYNSRLPIGLSKEDEENLKDVQAKLDDTPLTHKERRTAEAELLEKKRLVEKKRRDEYERDQQRLMDHFRTDAEWHFGFNTVSEPVKAAIHAKAWAKGHDAGLTSVLDEYEELVEFVELIIANS